MSYGNSLERCKNPRCPYCGCEESKILRYPPNKTQSWMSQGQARCLNCNRRFHFRAVPSDEQQEPQFGPPPLNYQQPPPLNHQQPPPVTGARHQEQSRKFRVFICGDCGSRCKIRYTRGEVRSYKCENPDCNRIYKVVGTEEIELREI